MRNPPKTLDGLPFRELLEVMPDVQAWMKDREGRYLWVNRAFLINYGLSRVGQVVGKTDRDLSPVHLAAYFQEGDQAVLAGRTVNQRLELWGDMITRPIGVRRPNCQWLGPKAALKVQLVSPAG